MRSWDHTPAHPSYTYKGSNLFLFLRAWPMMTAANCFFSTKIGSRNWGWEPHHNFLSPHRSYVQYSYSLRWKGLLVVVHSPRELAHIGIRSVDFEYRGGGEKMLSKTVVPTPVTIEIADSATYPTIRTETLGLPLLAKQKTHHGGR